MLFYNINLPCIYILMMLNTLYLFIQPYTYLPAIGSRVIVGVTATFFLLILGVLIYFKMNVEKREKN